MSELASVVNTVPNWTKHHPVPAHEAELAPYAVGHVPRVYYIPNFLSQQEHDSILHRVSSTPGRMVNGRRLINYGGLPHPKGMVASPLPAWVQPINDKVTSLQGAFPQGSKPNHCLVNHYALGQGIMPHEDGPLYAGHVALLSLQHGIMMNFRRRRDGDDKGVEQGGEGEETPFIHSTVYLQPRSLFLFKDELYTEHLHSIDNVNSDVIDARCLNIELLQGEVKERVDAQGITSQVAVPSCAQDIQGPQTVVPREGDRYSLTIRVVKKVLKTKLRL